MVMLFLPVLVIIAGSFAYCNSLTGPFLFDDTLWILGNPRLQGDVRFWAALFSEPARPVVTLTLLLNRATSGFHVVGYHLFNLLVHLAAALVLFGLVRRTLSDTALQARYGRSAPWIALSASLLWTVHPLQTESVTYIIQRAELLAGLCSLLVLYGLVRGACSPHPRRWYAVSILSCLLGMASKPVMVTAPLMAAFYDRALLAGSWRALWQQRRGLYLSLAATWLLLAVLVTLWLMTPAPTAGFLVPHRSLAGYALTQPGVVLHYLRLALWPHPLVLDYDWPIARTWRAILLPAIAVAALGGLTLWTWRRKPALGLLGAWVLLTLAPTSSIIPVADLAVEHRMYLPLAGLILLAVLGADALLRRWVSPRIRGAVAACALVVLVAALAAGTVRRNADYRSALVMWGDVVAQRPFNARAHTNLGLALAAEGRHEEAAAHYLRSLQLNPDEPETHNDLGASLAAQGRLEPAMSHYAEALRLAPWYAEAHNNLGKALLAEGKTSEALAHLFQALRLKPSSADVHYNVGNALVQHGEWDEAIQHYALALELRPQFPDAENNWGSVLTLQGRIAEARVHYLRALALDPDHPRARRNLERAGLASE